MKTVTVAVNLIFKRRNERLVAHIVKTDEGYFPISSYSKIPKISIYPPAKYKCKPNINYRCVLSIGDDGKYKFVKEPKALKMNVYIYPMPYKDGSGYKIVAQIGEKRLFLDPKNGASKNSRTLDGIVRAIKMMPDNFDKMSAINSVKYLHKLYMSGSQKIAGGMQ